ncbi:uncharacterized protein LOC143202755 isoform X2 [Rhynchophorus ferrugineus]|uniref:uncharacterized protein LOC143202755 isoform X2 n=1 Tax=Rhynchophorus ferrugineus TaxID=354439 RepID=UPI003FCE94D1
MFYEMYINLKRETIYCCCHGANDKLNIFKCIFKLIPLEFFGNVCNRTKFFFVVKRILSQSKGECIHVNCLWEDYIYDCITWLSPEENKNSVEVQLCQANILVLQTVVKPFINYFYYCLRDSKSRKYLFVSRCAMDSFIDKTHNFYMNTNILQPVHSGNIVSPSGILIFIPKSSTYMNHRPLVLQFPNEINILNVIKKKIKCLSDIFKKDFSSNLYECWKEYLKLNKYIKRVYAIKVDIVNAFGLVDQNILIGLIERNDIFTIAEKQFLFNYILNQYVCVRKPSQIYKWNIGLPQGCKLSPLLCDLYLSYMCHANLSQFTKTNSIIHRTMDDMLFISTSFDEICEFEIKTSETFIINGSKTQKFSHIGKDPCISYCGKIFNMESKEVSNDYSFEKDTEMRYKFKLWNRKYEIKKEDAFKFITNVIKFSTVSFYFSKFVLNTHFNSCDIVLTNIFEAMCLVAFKIDGAVHSISYAFSSAEHRTQTIQKCIDYILQHYTFKIKRLIEQTKGDFFENVFSYHAIKFVILRACIVVFNRRNQIYRDVIKCIKKEAKGLYLRKYDKKTYSVLPLKFKNIRMNRRQCMSNMEFRNTYEK